MIFRRTQARIREVVATPVDSGCEEIDVQGVSKLPTVWEVVALEAAAGGKQPPREKQEVCSSATSNVRS